MCGIAGLLAPERVREESVVAMLDLLVHRGPDGSGVWKSRLGTCVLGHRRLAILDLSSGGAQPMVDSAAALAVTYNGEIYNFVELRERLVGKGHVFRTQSDTEVLLRAYIEWGTDVLEHLNGMFAFALWDERKQEMFCARDRFGEKPFHYAWIDDTFAFASEAKALATLRGVDLALDEGVLAAQVRDGSTALDGAERTLLRGVKQLMPAHAMTLRRANGRFEKRLWCYWQAPADRHPYGEDDVASASQRLLNILSDSVRLRLRSDVRVGSCLSGGLDSSAIVSLMRRLESNVEIRTFTGRFPGDPLDEGRYARMVVEASRTMHFETEPTAELFRRDAERVYWHADFPIGGMSQFAQYCVFRLARDHDVTVLLDGQGSDEQLGGYGNSISAAFLRQLASERRYSAFARERRSAALGSPSMFAWHRLLLHGTPARRLVPLIRRTLRRSAVERSDFYRREFLSAAMPLAPHLPERSRDQDRSLSSSLWTLSFRTMLSSLLRFGDRLSMAHSREVRLPFCDHRLAEFAFTLSPELLVGDGQVKRVLRSAITGLVPDAIVTRPKQGFVPPQSKWLVGPLAGWFRELTESPGDLLRALDMSAVRRLAHASEDVRRRDVNVLWEVANVLAWCRYAWMPMRSLPKLAVTGAKEQAFETGVNS